MLNPRELFTLTSPQPVIDRPYLVHAMGTVMDAGHVGNDVTDAFLQDDRTVLLAEFDLDELRNYSAKRGRITFDGEKFTQYQAEAIALYLVHDEHGVPFLFLAGKEPDLRWNAFVEAIIELIEIYGVKTVVSLGAIPMAVPHTRPVQIIAHATDPQAVIRYANVTGEIQAPASCASLLEYTLGQRGYDAVGLIAQVPHYLANGHYPQAALALLTHFHDMTGLSCDVQTFAQRSSDVDEMIATQIEGNGDLQQMITVLEEQYEQSQPDMTSVFGTSEDLPDADEIASQVEEFLSQIHKDDEPS